jgi:hypothetical protein
MIFMIYHSHSGRVTDVFDGLRRLCYPRLSDSELIVHI